VFVGAVAGLQIPSLRLLNALSKRLATADHADSAHSHRPPLLLALSAAAANAKGGGGDGVGDDGPADGDGSIFMSDALTKIRAIIHDELTACMHADDAWSKVHANAQVSSDAANAQVSSK
jgi:hypothetical protein